MKYYFDNAATTFPKPKPVIEAMTKCLNESAVNAGRGSYDLAFEADKIIIDTRRSVKKLLKQKRGEIVFSSSATLALNQVLQGLSWQKDDAVYTTPFEHNSVARVMQSLKDGKGIKWDTLAFDPATLKFSLTEIENQFFRCPPKAIVISHASNVFGTITPIEAIARLARPYGACIVVDGAQAGPLLLKNEVDVDFYIFSGHKTFYGPFGIAGFWTNGNYHLNPILFGGTGSHSERLTMPNDYPYSQEVGSPNIVAINGLQAACAWLESIGTDSIINHEQRLLKQFMEGTSTIRGIKVWPFDEDHSVGITSFVLQDLSPHDIGMILNQKFSTAVRVGLHCAPLAHRSLGTLPSGTVRVSFSWFNRSDEVSDLIDNIKIIVFGE